MNFKLNFISNFKKFKELIIPHVKKIEQAIEQSKKEYYFVVSVGLVTKQIFDNLIVLQNLHIGDASQIYDHHDEPTTDDGTLPRVKSASKFRIRRQIMIVPLRIQGTQQEIQESLNEILSQMIENYDATNMNQIPEGSIATH